AKRSRLCSQKKTLRNCGFRCCTAMNHGNTIAKYKTIPGIQIVRRNRDHSLRSAANRKIMQNAKNGATGPLASVAAPPKKYRSKSQNFLSVSYQAYQPNMPMQNGAANCMSVDAPRANPIMPAQDTVIS